MDINHNRQNVSPDLDPNHFKLIMLLKEIFERVNFEKHKAEKPAGSTLFSKDRTSGLHMINSTKTPLSPTNYGSQDK